MFNLCVAFQTLQTLPAGSVPRSQKQPAFEHEDKPQYPGARSSFTTNLEFIIPENIEGIPVYRVMDRKGTILDPSQDPKVCHHCFHSICYLKSLSYSSCLLEIFCTLKAICLFVLWTGNSCKLIVTKWHYKLG